MNEGFITDDGYAAIPFGKNYIVIFGGQQLELCKTRKSAQKFINQHRSTPQKGTIFL